MQPQSSSNDQTAAPTADVTGAMPPIPGPMPPAAGSPAEAAPMPANPAPATQDAATPANADDKDVIEKEWVMQVKRVMRATAHDPYEQNRQFTQIKADYMQKRYGKNIKVDD